MGWFFPLRRRPCADLKTADTAPATCARYGSQPGRKSGEELRSTPIGPTQGKSCLSRPPSLSDGRSLNMLLLFAHLRGNCCHHANNANCAVALGGCQLASDSPGCRQQGSKRASQAALPEKQLNIYLCRLRGLGRKLLTGIYCWKLQWQRRLHTRDTSTRKDRTPSAECTRRCFLLT